MKIITKYSIGDKVDLGLYDRHRKREMATIYDIFIKVEGRINLEGTPRIEVTYWYSSENGYKSFELVEDGKTEAADNELGEQYDTAQD